MLLESEWKHTKKTLIFIIIYKTIIIRFLLIWFCFSCFISISQSRSLSRRLHFVFLLSHFLFVRCLRVIRRANRSTRDGVRTTTRRDGSSGAQERRRAIGHGRMFRDGRTGSCPPDPVLPCHHRHLPPAPPNAAPYNVSSTPPNRFFFRNWFVDLWVHSSRFYAFFLLKKNVFRFYDEQKG